MTNKIVVAKPGFDALTETNPNNLRFSSDYNTLKYDLEGSTTITVPSSGGALDQEFDIVTHNLGYHPFFSAYIKEMALERYYSLPYTFADWWGYIYFFAYVTTTKLVFRVMMDSNASPFNMTVWYKVFKNNLIL